MSRVCDTLPAMERVGDLRLGAEEEGTGLIKTYEATGPDGRSVRVRVVEPGVEFEAAGRERFERDARAASELEREGLVPITSWGSSDAVYVATLPLAAVDLETLLEGAEAPLPVAVSVGLARDVAQALDAAHAADLVHAGLRGNAVLVDRAGRARVTDFAIARLVTTTSGQNSTLMSTSIDALTPEQMSNPEDVAPETDVFGLGMLLYRSLTLKAPFDAPSTLGVSIRLSMGHADPIGKHGVELPAALGPLVMRMLKAKPKDRPSMAEVATELGSLVDGAEEWRRGLGVLAAPHIPEAAEVETAALAPAASSPVVGPPPASPAPVGPPLASAAPPLASAVPAPVGPPLASSVPAVPALAAPAPAAAPAYAAPAASGFGVAAGSSPWSPGAVAPPPAAPSPPALAAAPPPAISTDTSVDPSAWGTETGAESEPSPWDDGPPTMVAQVSSPEMHPTVRQDSPLADDLPDYLRELDGNPPCSAAEERVQQYLEPAPSSVHEADDPGGWPVTDDEPSQAVPRTVIMQDPSLASSQAMRIPDLSAPAGRPPPEVPVVPPPRKTAAMPLSGGPPVEVRRAAPRPPANREWLLWVGVGIGAIVLMAGMVVLIITLAS